VEFHVLESEPKLKLSLLQPTNIPIQLSQPSLCHPQNEVGPSREHKQLLYEKRWHGNLQADAKALVILLYVKSVKPKATKSHCKGISKA